MEEVIQKLKDNYRKACNEYVGVFCDKQEMSFEHWVGDAVGEVVGIGDFFFNFSDIVIDINEDRPKGLILDWYYYMVEKPEEAVNYLNYPHLVKSQ